MVNWKVIRRRFDGDDRVVGAFDEIAVAARRVRQGLLAGDEKQVAEAVAAEWAARRRLAPQVCPPELARIETVARSAGAHAVKATGAGGGGSVVLWHSPGGRPLLAAALEAAAPGGRVLAAGVAAAGCRILAGPAPVTD
jgi:galactokinase/mevalonate kinase-like predicted kinase